MRRISSRRLPVFLTQLVILALTLGPVLGVRPASADPGGVVTTGAVTAPGFIRPAFLFEPEFPVTSLKTVPTWNEVEQLLDNPYAVVLDPNTPGNTQDYVSYRSTITRRPSFGVTLPQFLVHPLNFNANIGEEMRLLNPDFAGAQWKVLDTECSTAPPGSTCIQGLVQDPVDPTRYTAIYRTVTVSPGAGRVEETALDANSPHEPDVTTCIASTEAFPVPEGSTICGGDPGEPGYAGLGVLLADSSGQYSVPAVPGGTKTSTIGLQLRDPQRGIIQPRDPTTGAGGLHKPSLRIPEVGGNPSAPNYGYNSLTNAQARATAAGEPAANAAAFIAPSNENDYVRNRDVAAALGKSLFWDMQVGSDGVQSCGTCHFTAGADNRTKNQVNPNHLGGDLTFQLRGGAAPNTFDLATSDFPFHKLADPNIAGDPACTTPLVANVSAVPAMVHPVAGDVTVCAASNIVSDANDVASSMGVVFSPFTDIPTPGGGVNSGAFAQVAGTNAVKPVTPDIRSFNQAPAALVDNFNRACPPATVCALGPNWTVQGSQTATNRFGIVNNEVRMGNGGTPAGTGWAYWNAAFGADQEASFKFTNIKPSTSATEHDIFLKIGPNETPQPAGVAEPGDGLIEVLYSHPVPPATQGQVQILTFDRYPCADPACLNPGRTQQWMTHATFSNVTFAVGDTFRAQARSDGTVSALKNGATIGTVNVTTGANPWRSAWASGGGKIGVQLTNAGGTNPSRFDDFAGGNLSAMSLALDPIPGFQGLRRVEPRNTPTIFAAAANFDNFWDGRARHDFNGGSVFGVADSQSHVFITNGAGGALTPTKQVIRFSSLASLGTGPGLSEFEMSFLGRNWAKIGKKLLQNGAVPLANQLAAADDSLLGPYSNQNTTSPSPLCTRPAAQKGAGVPGLCLSYNDLIRAAFYAPLHANTATHLNGCYTDGRSPACPAGTTADPFDGYVLTPAGGAAVASNTNQFTQMEGNFSLFWGMALDIWVTLLVPDDTPLDKFLDGNPDAGFSLGEPGEPALVGDLRLCSENGGQRPCLTELGNFKRDPGLTGHLPGTVAEQSGTAFISGGSRQPGQPDPLLGLDLFQGSNLSLKNPDFRSARCGECHQGGNLTDHNFDRTHLVTALDFAAEFATPGIELAVEPLGRPRLISGFLLESELNENGQDALERRFIDQSIVPNPVDGLAYPGGANPANWLPGFGPWTGAEAAFIDNGVYNLGVRPINEDVGRGGDDPFGWPLSLSALAMKNVAGPTFEPGNAMPNFDPDAEGFGVFEETAQDQQINPGLESELISPLLPPYIAPWINNITVGDAHPELDEAGGAPGGMYNTLTDVPMLEGFIDSLGPFNPAGTIPEAYSSAEGAFMGTWPVPNRVIRMGSFKAPQLREVELTGPYFHNGGKLTLRQVVDFYTRGGDFPITNAAHRDFNIVNLRLEVESNLTEEEIVSLVDFLLELTDDRVRFERAPFDHPEIFAPLDGRAPDNTFGRPGFVQRLTGDCNGIAGAGPCFLHSPATGAAGTATPERSFLGVTNERVAANDPVKCNPANGPISHYCH